MTSSFWSGAKSDVIDYFFSNCVLLLSFKVLINLSMVWDFFISFYAFFKITLICTSVRYNESNHFFTFQFFFCFWNCSQGDQKAPKWSLLVSAIVSQYTQSFCVIRFSIEGPFSVWSTQVSKGSSCMF